MNFNVIQTKEELPAHQQRVIEEANVLAVKLNALKDFSEGAIFSTLDAKEQGRLRRQFIFMELYWGVLHERINNF